MALCQLLTGRPATETVDRISRLYKSQRPNVQIGLRIRVAISERRYEDALGEWANLEPKDAPVHQALRRDALKGLLEHKYLQSDERIRLEAEVAGLDARLSVPLGVLDWDIDPD